MSILDVPNFALPFHNRIRQEKVLMYALENMGAAVRHYFGNFWALACRLSKLMFEKQTKTHAHMCYRNSAIAMSLTITYLNFVETILFIILILFQTCTKLNLKELV